APRLRTAPEHRRLPGRSRHGSRLEPAAGREAAVVPRGRPRLHRRRGHRERPAGLRRRGDLQDPAPPQRPEASEPGGWDRPAVPHVTSFIHPHDPYEPPKANWDRFAEEAIPDPAHPEVPDAAVDPHSHRLRTMCGFDQRDPGIEDVRRARRAYYAAVNYIDDHIGAIRRRLE